MRRAIDYLLSYPAWRQDGHDDERLVDREVLTELAEQLAFDLFDGRLADHQSTLVRCGSSLGRHVSTVVGARPKGTSWSTDRRTPTRTAQRTD
ncbi:hypothetical protein ACFYV7_30530 [Nocardia suismassiliense]|uniref:Uncharacterized protein n=1 Tax=Nocardia suismassiliense TaxID=2077092 RepID=A0ABW6R158_9NOCA